MFKLIFSHKSSFRKPEYGVYLGWILAVILNLTSIELLAGVTLNGVEGSAKDNAWLMLSLAKQPCDSPSWKVKHLYSEADAEIDKALRALGYYHSSAKKTLTWSKECWNAEVNVDTGPQTRVDQVDIRLDGDARDAPEFVALLKNLPLKKGDPLHHGRYESMKSKIESLALDLGYLKHKFTEKKLIVDKASNKAFIKLAFDSGERLREHVQPPTPFVADDLGTFDRDERRDVAHFAQPLCDRVRNQLAVREHLEIAVRMIGADVEQFRMQERFTAEDSEEAVAVLLGVADEVVHFGARDPLARRLHVHPASLASQLTTRDHADEQERREVLAALQALLVQLHAADALHAEIPGELVQQPRIGFSQHPFGERENHQDSFTAARASSATSPGSSR